MKHKQLLILSSLLFLIYSFTEKNDKLKIENNGVLIAYTDTHKGDTTLFFVHGWCLNKSYWTNQVKFFSSKYRVITIDLPGFGVSGKNRSVWNTAVYASDVNSVINKLKLKNVILIGHSMAGDIVLQAAINDSQHVVGLIGVDNFKATAHILSKKEIQGNTTAIKQMKLHFKQVAYQYFNQSLFYKTTNNSIKKRILNDVAHTDSVVAVKSLEGALQQMQYDERAKLLSLKKKLYLINSDYTVTDTLSLIAKHIPYQLYSIHATGHFPMVEKPDDFNFKLATIIKSIYSQ